MSSPGSWSNLFHPELIVPEAFDPVEEFRIPRQVASALGIPLQTVMSFMGEWTRRCHWAEVLTEYAKDLNISHYIYHARRLISFELRDSHKPSLIFNVWSEHIYLYKGAGSFAEEDAKHALARQQTSSPPSAQVVETGEDGPETTESSPKVPPYNRQWALLKEDRHLPAAVEEFSLFPWATAEDDLADVPSGRYWVFPILPLHMCEDDYRHMDGLLKLFARSHRYPRVTQSVLGQEIRITELAYTKVQGKDNGSGCIIVRSHALDSEATATWAKKLDVPYAGQSLGPFAGIVLDTLLRKRCRRYLTKGEKQQLLTEQKRQCALCGDVLADSEVIFDHTIPLHEMTADQSLDAFQAICGQCSANKSASESRPTVGILKSRFNEPARAMYLECPKPPCMQFCDSEADGADMFSSRPVTTLMAVDIKRCRWNALRHAAYLPVFCALDDVLPINPDHELPDLVYIDRAHDVHTLENIISALPFYGPAWYARPAVEYLLHTKRVTWDDLKTGITATGRIEGDAVRSALDIMEAAWADITRLESPEDNLAKRSFNNWIGCCGMPPYMSRLKTTLSGDLGDFSPTADKSTQVKTILPGLHMYTATIPEVDSGTYRPIYDYCLAVEHTRLAQAYQAIQQVYKIARLPVPLVNVVGDGIIWDRPRKRVTADKVKVLLESIAHRHLPELEKHIRDHLHQTEPKQKRLRTDDLYPISSTCPSDDLVFRVVTPLAKQLLRGKEYRRRPVLDYHFCAPGTSWNDVTEADIFDWVVNEHSSVFVRGIAGTGKSHLIRQTLIPALEARGKRVVVIAKTHNAALVAGGDTCDHFAWKHIREGGTGAYVIWVDEVSMLDARLLDDLNHASMRDPPIQWILSGDFNQYQPFFSTFRGSQVEKSFEDSALLRRLADCTRLTLTTCHRSDPALFEWYASLAADPLGWRHSRPLSANVEEAIATFTPDRAAGFIPDTKLAPTNLVISHRRRVSINAQCNEATRRDHPEAVHFTLAEYEVECESGTNHPQDAWFWPEMKVVACCKGRKLRNGRAYYIQSIGDKQVILEPAEASGDVAADKPVTLTRAAFFKQLRLPFAVTYASAQGLTLEGLIALHDTRHTYFDWRKLFVGLSRARGMDKVVVYE